MKASDIKPGMVIDGWTVTAVHKAALQMLCFELELLGEVLHEGEESTIQAVKRARTWYRADEEVDAE